MLIKPKKQELTSMLAALERYIVSTEWVINPINIQGPAHQLNIYGSHGKGNQDHRLQSKRQIIVFCTFHYYKENRMSGRPLWILEASYPEAGNIAPVHYQMTQKVGCFEWDAEQERAL